MKYFSSFTGIGGFDLALRKFGFEAVGFSEIARHANAVLRYRFPNVPNFGDIRHIEWANVPDFDLLVGGTPCQDLSLARIGRKGLAGTESGLFFEFVRALKEKRPKYFLWENVAGALSSNGGWDFAVVLDSLAKEGYGLWWQVLDAKWFGVPQHRERVFIFGVRGECPRQVFFEPAGTAESDGLHEQVANTITARYYRAKQGTGTYVVESQPQEITEKAPIEYRVYATTGIAPTLHRKTGGGMVPKILEGARIRYLTPREAERLMGWPDDWTRWGVDENGKVYELSDSARYNLIGNGVVPQVVEAIIKLHVEGSDDVRA